MFDEQALRRPSFLQGVPLRLADGGFWTVPMPVDPTPSEHQPEVPARTPEFLGARYIALLEVLRDAEDNAEVLRAELALAIFLLRQNYDLDPETLGRLLSFSNKDDLARMQRTMSEVASAHLRALRSSSVRTSSAPERRWFRSSTVRAFST